MENCSSKQKLYHYKQNSNPSLNEAHDININLSPQNFSNCDTSNTREIIIQPQPIKLDIDTPTDWPAVIASTLVAFAVGYMAYISQRNQLRSTKANFRHVWQQDLKKLIAKFISVTARIHYELSSNPDYLSSSESNELYSELIEVNSQIELMLDRSQDYTKKISRITDNLVFAVKDKKIEKIDQLTNELIEVGNSVIEKAWQDINNDLEGKTKKGTRLG